MIQYNDFTVNKIILPLGMIGTQIFTFHKISCKTKNNKYKNKKTKKRNK